MSELNISQTTTPSKVTDYSVTPISPDSPANQDENYWYFTNFTKWFGNYKQVAKIKTAINAYATWVLGKGWTATPDISVTLENITGSGEDTFNSILWNLIVTKKVNGDAFAQIIRDTDSGELINLIPLNPEYMKVVFNKKGRIIRYDYLTPAGTNKSGVEVPFKTKDILHLMNDRVINEMHGTSSIEAVEWNVSATDEAKIAHRKMIKRNGVVRVIEVDTDDNTKLAVLKAQWKDAIDKGDVLIIPKGVAEAKDWHGVLDTAGVVQWLKYLDDDFYTSIGVPRVILGGSSEFTEASSKVAYLTYEQVYTRETTELEADLWNQLQVRIIFNKPVSLKNEMLQSESKNTSQVGFQPNDTTIGSGQA